MNSCHIPVMKKEVLDYLNPQAGQNFIDCTFGGGGHTREILKLTAPDGFILGVDQDPEAVKRGRILEKEFPGRFNILHKRFSQITKSDYVDGHNKINAIILDLGLSSCQLEGKNRGFSFRKTAPLDMRMDGGDIRASDVINSYSQDELTKIFKEYGEERHAKGIAQRIFDTRKEKKIETTDQLVQIIEKFYSNKKKPKRIHPATKVFQALRMEVNQELQELEAFLPKAIEILESGGRIAVISFHSGEDRIVKQFFREHSKDLIDTTSLTGSDVIRKATIKLLTKKPITPSAHEIEANPRSRSAKLRVAEKL